MRMAQGPCPWRHRPQPHPKRTPLALGLIYVAQDFESRGQVFTSLKKGGDAALAFSANSSDSLPSFRLRGYILVAIKGHISYYLLFFLYKEKVAQASKERV